MASTKKRIGLLPVYEINQLQDWELEGYYYNYKTAAQYVPRNKLVSFMTPAILGSLTPPTQITVRKLSIKGSLKTVLDSTDYTVTMGAKEKNGFTQYYFNQQILSGGELDRGCLYDIYIEDTSGNKFVSNIFIAVDESDIVLYLESGIEFSLEDGQSLLVE